MLRIKFSIFIRMAVSEWKQVLIFIKATKISDIDTVIMVPNYVNRDQDFFEILYELLKSSYFIYKFSYIILNYT